ncbi:hypothetical protein SAMN05443377_10122 [Propionibacterium cyclohexanicum]|uniref:Uncharacterized protein n=1 Tax=Propionibacterium cyclohexanicum TaxID=64702 RepID=A0A1H9PHB5_9ACTN|nr:C4-type zinc ribbon domain-containing protein [Propionibacterium cyclohexanicum]SER47255.1 hypothetical protein SAMN05443377_10122 [Propionibacterium cyclohexanicum]
MLADPTAQRRLLDVAALDSKLLQLRHQSGHLPENEELAQLQTVRLELVERITATKTRQEDAQRQLERAEADLTPVRARLERDEKRAKDGLVVEQRAMASLQAEIDHLKGRIDDLEEDELEAMQQVEDEGRQHEELVAQRTEIENRMRALLSQREDTKATIARQAESLTRERTAAAESLPADLLADYERIHKRSGSTAAAELRARRCGGCGLELDVAELRRFAAAPATEVLHCEECGRILVRTEKSGL